MRLRLARLTGAVLLLLAVPGTASADHEDGLYEMPARSIWDTGDLEVLIVPPNHGQVYNSDEGALGGGDPNELTPYNSYLRAIEASIEEWNRGVEMLGSEQLKNTYNPHVYVLGRDLPAQGLYDPDIIVTTDENKGPVLGFALSGPGPCIVNNSRMYVQSFSYADMYNVNAQEYGHCLGLGHVGSQGGADPTSDQKHPEHDVMNGFYADSVGAKDTHLHCVSNLNVAGLEYVFGGLTGTGQSHTVYMPVEDYRTTCEGPSGASGAPATVITSPQEGSEVQRGAFRRLAGTASGSVESVKVALQRNTDSGCEWWKPSRKRFASGSCERPRWFSAAGTDEWSHRLRARLPAGNYVAFSQGRDEARGYFEECCEPGRNEISFTLR